MVHGAAQAAADRRQRASSFIGDEGTTFHTAVRRWRRSSFYRRNRRACQAAAPAPRTRATLRPRHVAGAIAHAAARYHAAALYNERDYATPHANFPSR